MSKKILSYKEVTVKVPKEIRYSCDTCGYVFRKGERKVTYYGGNGKMHACYDKPCSPFSNPKDYEYEFDTELQGYKWIPAQSTTTNQGEDNA